MNTQSKPFKSNNFVHLHVHSEYSLLNSTCRIDDLVQKTAALGQNAIAVTDNCAMYGEVDFYKAAKAAGIKPILGCEIYVSPTPLTDKTKLSDTDLFHLTILCENNTGYRNLVKLVSESYTRYSLPIPCVDKSQLKKYSEGLICLSGCIRGEIPSLVEKGEYDKALKAALEYKSIFGCDNFFIELWDHDTIVEKRILPQLLKIASESGLQAVATNNVHYMEKQDAQAQELLVCIRMKTNIFDENHVKLPTNEFYLKSSQEMQELFSGIPTAIENTVRIAERCNVEFEFGVIRLPEFKTGLELSNKDYFIRLCIKGLVKRYGNPPPENAKKRMEHELSVITKMGYEDYYLIVWDFVKYAKDHDIPVGPGRGSGAGSICAYCIGITDIDPLQYNLLFERFLNPERISMPDFDIDFCIEGRQKVIEYVVHKYGSQRVSQIIAFDTLKARAAIKDTGRALGTSVKFRNDISNLIPKELTINISTALMKNPELNALYKNNPSVKKVLDMSMKIEGLPRNDTIHAAGVLISKLPVTDIVPVKLSGDTVVTQYTMSGLESLGLLKMDFLGLRNLTIIKHCVDKIKKYEPDFDIRKIPTDDARTFEMMSAGETTGVFQFESAGMRRVLTRLRPENIEDLIAVLSLYRPGPADSIPRYIKNKHDPKHITYKHPLLKEILEVTYGCIIYQEQVMEICRTLAGYSLGRADLMRRAMAKKKHDIMEKERHSFIYGDDGSSGNSPCTGALEAGVDEKTANEIFDEMSGFASYAFNKSHAAAYAYLAYQTAYLKCRYKKEYMAALMSSVMDRTDKLAEYVRECREHGISVLPPDINHSTSDFTPEDRGIRCGLMALKGLGAGVIRDIIRIRSDGSYKDLRDFCRKTTGIGLNKLACESLIKSGAFDIFPETRREMLTDYAGIMDAEADNSRNQLEGQIGLFDDGESADDPVMPIRTPMPEFPHSKLMEMEREAMGMYISGHPVDGYMTSLELMHTTDCRTAAQSLTGKKYKSNTPVTICGALEELSIRYTSTSRKMAFVKLSDNTGYCECTVFPDTFITSENKLHEGKLLFIMGKVTVNSKYNDSISAEIIYDEEELVKHIEKKRLCIKLDSRNKTRTGEVVKILMSHKGSTQVCYYLTDTKKLVKPGNISGIVLTDELVEKLKSAAGENNVGLID